MPQLHLNLTERTLAGLRKIADYEGVSMTAYVALKLNPIVAEHPAVAPPSAKPLREPGKAA